MKKEIKNAGKKKSAPLTPPVFPVTISPSPPSISSSQKRTDLLDSMRDLGKSFAKQFLLFSAIFLLLGLVVFFVSPSFLPRPSWAWTFSEEPMVKNAYLNITPGERFVYLLDAGVQNQTRVIEAASSSSCPGVMLVDLNARQAAGAAADQSLYSVCLGQDGLERAPNGSIAGSNFSSSNLWSYEQPWMLALSDNFNWSLNATLTIQPFNLTQVTLYRYWVSGRTLISGRDAFEVHVYSRILQSGSNLPPLSSQQAGGELPLRLFVDSQRRVLLRAEFSDSNLTLIEAPFISKNAPN